MDINLPADQEALVGHLVASGQFRSADEVVSESIRLLASRQKLKDQVRLGIEQADRGEMVDHDTVFAQLRSLVAAQSGASSGR
jgi:antitoxin ParD1/3/4